MNNKSLRGAKRVKGPIRSLVTSFLGTVLRTGLLRPYGARNDARFTCVILCAGIFFSGCAPVLIGGAAVGGAIVIAQDSATTSVDMDFRHVWSVANTQMRKLGEVEKSFQKLGEIKGKVEGAHVTVKIARLTEKTVDITVTARKNLLPDTTLAQAILTSIIRNL